MSMKIHMSFTFTDIVRQPYVIESRVSPPAQGSPGKINRKLKNLINQSCTFRHSLLVAAEAPLVIGRVTLTIVPQISRAASTTTRSLRGARTRTCIPSTWYLTTPYSYVRSMIITVIRFILRRIAFYVPDYFTVQSQSRLQELEGVLGEKEKVVQALQKQVCTRRTTPQP